MPKYTLCWTCANATGGCSWSQEFIPVEGWNAIPTKTKEFSSFHVIECPRYKQDSRDGGMAKLGPKQDLNDLPATGYQMDRIMRIEKKYNVPEFTGETRKEAAEWIKTYGGLA